MLTIFIMQLTSNKTYPTPQIISELILKIGALVLLFVRKTPNDDFQALP
jgi:hypothetical protein